MYYKVTLEKHKKHDLSYLWGNTPEETQEEIIFNTQQIYTSKQLKTSPLILPEEEPAYDKYKIPKKNGGKRELTVPNESLRNIQNQILKTLQNYLPHNAAHAFVPKRSVYTALKQHQKADNTYFIQLDIKDFFGNISQEIFRKILKERMYLRLSDDYIEQILEYCFFEGSLPQGACTSPHISNIYMLPFDDKITYQLHKLKATYTRYADDIVISVKNKNAALEIITQIKNNLPPGLELNDEKTKITTKNGRNWVHGLMYNQDSEITIGHRRKKQFKQKLHQYLTKPESRTKEQYQHIMGLYAFFKMVEPKYAKYILQKYEEKYNIKMQQTLSTLPK